MQRTCWSHLLSSHISRPPIDSLPYALSPETARIIEALNPALSTTANPKAETNEDQARNFEGSVDGVWLRSGAKGFGCSVQDLGLRVSGLRFRELPTEAWSMRLRVQDVGMGYEDRKARMADVVCSARLERLSS